VFDNYYGTPKKNVRDLLKSGKHVLLCIDVKGAKVVRKICPEAITVFIKTPSIAVLKKRLDKRADTHDTAALRLKIARQELAQAKYYDHRIVNDHLSTAYRQLEEVVCQTLFPPVL
jgi:guanylate kinase